MTQSLSHLSAQIKTAVARWFTSRAEECGHCRGCSSKVRPWDEYCQNCGQRAPAKVSATAGIGLAVAFLLAAIVIGAIML